VKCPIDESPLSVSSRDGVEIDFCPQCRGVWLDRGELDKIIDRAAATLSTAAPTSRGYEPVREEPRFDDDDRRRYEERARYDDRSRGRPRKRRSFLDDLFDFD
jgi:Zn-finger nucleic acid-binding protein